MPFHNLATKFFSDACDGRKMVARLKVHGSHLQVTPRRTSHIIHFFPHAQKFKYYISEMSASPWPSGQSNRC